jgi:RNA-directed DNA polymerase
VQSSCTVPTMYDRALQALVKTVIEPEWEARFEPNSYGFRPGRSTHDAISQIKKTIQQASKYVLDADIAKCFDCIDHSALLQKAGYHGIIRKQIKAWLKAGVFDQGAFATTFKGTPQGGVISPLLANIALHGLEETLMEYARNAKGWITPKGDQLSPTKRVFSLTIVRYADDFVVFHQNKAVVQECREIISEWLKGIGLELKPEKTRLAHTLLKDESEDGVAGFDFR